MPNTAIPAAATGLPNTSPAKPHEPAFAVTEAGRMYLLLQTIVDRLHIDGSSATFELTPDLADELAVFGAETEDLELDDPSEEDTPYEASEQLESDCRFEPYKPLELKPPRRVRRSRKPA